MIELVDFLSHLIPLFQYCLLTIFAFEFVLIRQRLILSFDYLIMAAASYYQHESHSPPAPALTREVFSMRPAHHEYTNVPQSFEDSPNPQLSTPMKGQEQFNRIKQRKVEQWKRYARLLKLLSLIVTSIFSLAMFGIMVFVLVKYETTKNTIRDGRGPWPIHTKLWPSIMLLVGAGFTLVLSIFVLCAYCCCFKMTQRSWKVTVAKNALHIVSWAVISFLYRYEKSLHGNNNDLWGWACAKEATALQPAFNAVLDFDSLCGVQVWHKRYLRQFELAQANPRTVELMGCLPGRNRHQSRFCGWALFPL